MTRWMRYWILGAVIVIHLIVLFTVTVTTRVREQKEDPTVFKMVDVSEYVPPPPDQTEPPPDQPPPPESAPVISDGPAETVIETEEELPPQQPAPRREPTEYVPQHRVSKPPGIPADTIRSRIQYPPLANRQGIEGVVYLELFVDADGVIQKIEVLRDPGYGLADAAIAAFDGITVTPAEANGVPVAVRYRYPVRFALR